MEIISITTVYKIFPLKHLTKEVTSYTLNLLEFHNGFSGTIIHSHSYRTSEPYKCRRVLVIGGGPSGMEIGLALTDVCSKVFHSHHSRVNFRTPFPKNYVKKPDVTQLNETGAFFADGSFEEIDDIIYCTGNLFLNF